VGNYTLPVHPVLRAVAYAVPAGPFIANAIAQAEAVVLSFGVLPNTANAYQAATARNEKYHFLPPTHNLSIFPPKSISRSLGATLKIWTKF